MATEAFPEAPGSDRDGLAESRADQPVKDFAEYEVDALRRERDALTICVDRAERACGNARQQLNELKLMVAHYQKRHHATKNHIKRLDEQWDRQLDEAKTKLQKRERENSFLQGELQDCQKKLQSSQAEVLQLKAEIAKYEAHLESKDRFIQEIMRSLSWRLTNPLRMLKRHLS
jgi:chromosome segregation ATPase